jgi:hypothetical protein
MAPNMITEELCMSNRVQLLSGWDYMDTFRELVYADPDAIKTLAAQEVSDKFDSNYLPTISWYLIWY